MQVWYAKVSIRRIAWMTCLIATSLLTVSCEKEDGRGEKHDVFPVEGEITINGKPAVGVEVTLHPVTPLPPVNSIRTAVVPNGNVDTDGIYRISTYKMFDGAPAATYNISLFAKSKGGKRISKGDEGIVDRFEGKYKNADENAKNDPQHFTVVVNRGESGASADPVKVPKLEIDYPGFWPEETTNE